MRQLLITVKKNARYRILKIFCLMMMASKPATIAAAEQPGMDENQWAAESNAHDRTIVELWREQHVCRTDHVYLMISMGLRLEASQLGHRPASRAIASTIFWVSADAAKVWLAPR